MSKESFNFIKNTFIKLTSKTYPYGYEDELVEEMTEAGVFPKNLEKDIHGNYFFKIGESRTIFASHLDTACKDQVEVKHQFQGNIIKTDGKSILGADDKAGVTIMLWMMKHQIPGLYYFFFGEEVGCIGSSLRSKTIEQNWDRIISFDRRGNNSVITHQSSTRSCSDEFAKALAKELNKGGLSYKTDSTGAYTDSAEFVSQISECTNISVGYNSEHTFNESQDILHLHKLAVACLNVDWENLPTKRDKNKKESLYDWDSYDSRTATSWNSRGFSRKPKSWSNKNYHNYDYGQYYDDEDYYHNSGMSKQRKARTYYDSGKGQLKEMEVTSFKTTTDVDYKYESVKDKFFNTSLSKEEIEVIKNQYLDMKNPDDRNCYEVMVNSLVY